MTGQVIIEWVDGAEPEDQSVAPNFGWSMRAEPQLDDERLAILLREICDVM
jgi:hypothetical protein